VVETVAPADSPEDADASASPDGDPVQYYYDARYVQKIVLEADGVRLYYHERLPNGDAGDLREIFHRHPEADSPPHERAPNIRRRNGLTDFQAARIAPVASPTLPANSRILSGGTLLAGEIERPYRFIVVIHRTFEHQQDMERLWRKVRAILDAEKPAHTQYTVRFMPAAGRPQPMWMQIEVRSSIGLDATIS
jgi:hypothetical protein